MNRLLRGVNLPEDAAAAAAFRHGRGNFQLHYALDDDIEWLTPGLDEVALIHLADGIDSVSKSANEAERGLLPVAPTICVGQPHRLDPSRCPPGKAILWLQIPDAPRVIKGDAAGEIETDPRLDRSHARGLCRPDRADPVPPHQGSRPHETRPPGLFARRSRRDERQPCGRRPLRRGLLGIDQFFLWRPFAHSTNGTSRLRGLRHIGASTHPGPGLGGGSGFLAAKALGA